MQYYNSNGEVVVQYFTKQKFYNEENMLFSITNLPFNKPNNIGIIYLETEDRDNPTLAQQLKYNSCRTYNSLTNKPPMLHPFKRVLHITECLSNMEEEYALVVRNNVLLLGELNELIKRYEEFGDKVVISNDDAIHNAMKVLQCSCCFGKTEVLLKFYSELNNLINRLYFPQWIVIKGFLNTRKDYIFDTDNKLFNKWNNPNYSFSVDNEKDVFLLDNEK